jgi:hypothetical protein
VLLAALWAASAGAQGALPPATGTPGVAGELRTVDGRLLRGGSGTPQPLPGQFVVLHRISADSAGPIDSIRTSAVGRYRFQYRLESTSAMYIVSARHDGVAYFSTPLRTPAVSGADADLVVFDTTSRRFPMAVRSRHFVVSPPDESGLRRVVDVFEVANDSSRTLVVGDGGGTWQARLPAAARDPESSGGDLPAEALRFEGGIASLQAPFPPGSRQVVLTYGIPRDGTVEVPLDAGTARVEVLVEGAGATLGGGVLAAEAPVTMEGRTFQRAVGGPIAADASFTLRWSGGGLGGRAGRLALLGLAAVAVALGVLYGRRAKAQAPSRGPVHGSDALARAIASLDRVYDDPARRNAPSQAAYQARRAELKSRLVAALTVEDGGDAR